MAKSTRALAYALLLALAPAALAAPAPVPLEDEPEETVPGTAPDPTETTPPKDEGAAPDPTEAAGSKTLPDDPDEGSGLGNVGEAEDKGPRGLGHGKQFGLSAVLGTGFRGIFPYDKEPCSNVPGEETCTGRAPATLDFGASYGLSDGFELMAELRIGMEAESLTDEHQFAFMPGFRVYFDPESSFKLFLGVAMVIDNTDWSGAGVKSPDFGGRIALGAQLDFVRHFGFYVQGAASVAARRWFSFQVDGGAGVQVRFP